MPLSQNSNLFEDPDADIPGEFLNVPVIQIEDQLLATLISIMKRAISKQFDSLTEYTPAYKMVAIPNKEVETMKGKVYPPRSGFRLYWPWKSEAFWFYQDQFGKPFKHGFYALEFLYYLNK